VAKGASLNQAYGALEAMQKLMNGQLNGFQPTIDNRANARAICISGRVESSG
jgi:hypothetical protein